MLGMFNRAKISIPCPECGHKTNKTLRWIKAHSQYTCAGCRKTVNLDSKDLTKELAGAEKAIEKLRRDIAKIGPINIDF